MQHNPTCLYHSCNSRYGSFHSSFLVLQLKNMATTPKSQHNELKPQDLQHNYIPCNKYGNTEFLATQIGSRLQPFPLSLSLSVRLSVCLSITCNSKHIPLSLSLSVCLLLATKMSQHIQYFSIATQSKISLSLFLHLRCNSTNCNTSNLLQLIKHIGNTATHFNTTSPSLSVCLFVCCNLKHRNTNISLSLSLSLLQHKHQQHKAP